MTIKYDNFLIDLKEILDKNNLSFGFTYDGLTVIDKDIELDEDLYTLFDDETTE